MTQESKVPAKRPGTEVGTFVDYGEHAGRGFEGQTADDVLIPLIALLQPGSPQVKDEVIPGAKAGLLFNTVTQELAATLDFVPAIVQHLAVEWVPRARGGGFVGVHALDSDVVKRARAGSKEFGKMSTQYGPNGERQGNELADTYYVYSVCCLSDEVNSVAVIPFASTKIKVWKAMNTRLQMLTIRAPDGRKLNPPMFAHLLRLGSFDDKNAKGEYKNFTLSTAWRKSLTENLLQPDDPRFLAALELRHLIESGKGRAAYETETPVVDDGAGETPF